MSQVKMTMIQMFLCMQNKFILSDKHTLEAGQTKCYTCKTRVVVAEVRFEVYMF